ncbi:MAG: bifunctional metallophosphatase/5'-nucleotidase [Chloroflexi bacterium]|nr:bifunctional metallophosphatase/5'-nucleotidase [Chloroflexota bacterium]
MGTKKLTLLHSNDMHGDFLAESQGASGNLIGGLSLLSGYINQVRKEEENVLYAIAGDMLQGSMIDTEYRGVSTIEMMNYLAPDVVTLGNHELDYGLYHLLFLEKMANFPIVNANMYIKKYNKRLMRPYLIVEKAGIQILFIGVITDLILASLKTDTQIGSFISLEQAAAEVGRICNVYKSEDIELTVLLTHIGFDADKEMAALLKPEWGVDLIIGGHSHTLLEKPEIVNGIPIVQVGVGTNQIGRFDLLVDDDTNRVMELNWQLVPIDNQHAQPDAQLEAYINSYRDAVDRKYDGIVCRLVQQLTHPTRGQETALGNLIADIFQERANVDVALVGSGSIRGEQMGPLVTLGELKAVYPYDGSLHKCTVTGAQLKKVFAHTLRPASESGAGSVYQVNRGVRAIYDRARRELQALTLNGQPVQDDQRYTLCLQYYTYNNLHFLDLTEAELSALAPPRVVTSSAQEVLEEYLRAHQNINSVVEGRLTFVN